ncbi:MAG: hypothetical protein NUV73_03400 [Candidatus Daviesbacteria bacterium]|nr:hypothetical protein [Candidatus Daviesbacteria bacterium]
MRKFTIKFILLVFTFYILHFTFYIPAAFAADSTPSADIKTKLEELKKEIASRAAKIKQEVNRKLKDKVYAGTIQAKSETSLTIATPSGPKMVSVNQDTLFESKKGAASKNKKSVVAINSLTQDDYIAALGDSDETGVLLARKIILLPTQNSLLKTYLWGQIVSRSDNLVNIKGKGFKNIATSLPASAKVNLNNIVILTGVKNEEEIIEAEFVHVISQNGVVKPKKIATPSGNTASPSAKPLN